MNNMLKWLYNERKEVSKGRISMDIKDFLDRMFTLGIGAAIASKEQIEKLVDELVEKGNVAKEESADIVDELMKKGKEYQSKFEASIKEKVKQTLKDHDFVTKEEFDKLKKRVEELEAQLKTKTDD
jgi:polyhydroxyalkanoate synthesis regulator phasin